MKTKKPKTRGRFVIEHTLDGWTLIDNNNNRCIDWPTKKEAMREATFCRRYVKKWGDICFDPYPMGINEGPPDDEYMAEYHKEGNE